MITERRNELTSFHCHALNNNYNLQGKIGIINLGVYRSNQPSLPSPLGRTGWVMSLAEPAFFYVFQNTKLFEFLNCCTCFLEHRKLTAINIIRSGRQCPRPVGGGVATRGVRRFGVLLRRGPDERRPQVGRRSVSSRGLSCDLLTASRVRLDLVDHKCANEWHREIPNFSLLCITYQKNSKNNI